MNLLLAAALAGVIALVGRGLGWLTSGGALAATGVGTAVLYGMGVRGGILLAVFFVSGSVLPRAASRTSPVDHSPRRNERQVLANGAWAAAAALLPTSPASWALYSGALAAALADTCATETGALSRTAPRMITTGETVQRGTSGGVTRLGTLGGLTGALVMGSIAGWCSDSTIVGVSAAVGGGLGMLLDSLLGATLQGVYFCSSCRVETEDAHHTCGTTGARVRGSRWVDNDVVNCCATATGATAAFGVWLAVSSLS